MRQARELGFKGLIIRSGGPSTPEIVAVAGKAAAEGMMVNAPVDPANTAVKAYGERYAAKYKKNMNGFSPAFYDGTHMLFQAMQKAGTVADTDKVRVALEQIRDYRGILGVLNWTGQDVYGASHQIDAPYFISEVKDGQEVVRARCNLKACQ